MFAIIISEKGGAERKESFDKNEINVGRVQGNDLMLPKGNVSKHHARLLFRDGRFIVTDLKSTNGTYVNGRKIAQATIVREGDKIYIGDFVLRLEANGMAEAIEPAAAVVSDVSTRSPARPPAQAAVTMQASTHPPGVPPPRPVASSVSNAPPPLGGPPPAQRDVDAPVFALDRDPDEAAPAPPKPLGGTPPPAPLGGAGFRPQTQPLRQSIPPPLGPRLSGAPPPLPSAPPPPAVQAPPAPPAGAIAAPAPQPTPAASPSMPPRGRAASPARAPSKDAPAQAGRRLALITLLDRVARAIDLSPLRESAEVPERLTQELERAAQEQAKAMRDEGAAPEGIDLEAVARDAQRELVGIGAFAPLLDDDEVGEIHCTRFDQLLSLRGGKVVSESSSFSSEEALERAVARLIHQSGEPRKPGELVVERRLPRAALVAITPPAAAHHVVTIRKRRRVETTLDELARAGSLSRPMAQFLEACAAARANVLVSGDAPLPMLSALASAGGGPGERVVVVQDVDELGVGSAHVASLSAPDTRSAGEECVRAAARLRADRLVVTQLAGGVAAATLDAISEGVGGVLAAASAHSLRQGIGRLVSQLVLYRPGLPLEAAREVVGEAFEIGVEVGSGPDGRLRVTRIAELGGADAKGVIARDVFVWNADPGGGEGTFTATGVVPRMAGELAARGTKLDPALFKRTGR